MQEVTFVSEQPPQVQAVAPTLTEEEQAKNEQSVLDDLEMSDNAKYADYGSKTGTGKILWH